MIRGEKKTVSIVLPIEIYNKIDALAKDTCRTRAGYIRQIIRVYLRNLEESTMPDQGWEIK